MSDILYGALSVTNIALYGAKSFISNILRNNISYNCMT